VTSPYLNRPIRSRAEVLGDLRDKMRRLHLLDPERKEVVRRIVALEDEMERAGEDILR